MIFKIKAVIFDMDGVITNTMPDHFFAWKHVLRKFGVVVTHEDIYFREGQKGIQSVKEIFEKYKIPYNKNIGYKILKEKERLFKKIVKTRFIAGSRKFIKGLNERGFKLALVTGTSRHELHKILPEHIYELFSVTVTGCDVSAGKPNPEPYLSALKKMKIGKDDAIVIENAPLGIESAKRAGLTCFALETSLSKKYLKKADFIFESFKELSQNIKFELKENI